MKDYASYKAKKLVQTLNYLAARNAVLEVENKGLCAQVSSKKTLKKDCTVLPLKQKKKYYSDAVFWSPSSVQQAKQEDRLKRCEKLEADAAKARKKQEKAKKKLRNKQEKEERRVAQIKEKEVAAERRVA